MSIFLDFPCHICILFVYALLPIFCFPSHPGYGNLGGLGAGGLGAGGLGAGEYFHAGNKTRIGCMSMQTVEFNWQRVRK